MEAVRMSLADAADHLGLAVNSVRSRWKAGKIRGERDNSGKVWVWLEPGSDVRKSKPLSQPSIEGEVNALREHIRSLNEQVFQVRTERDALAVRASDADRLAGELVGLQTIHEEIRTDRDYWRSEAQRLGNPVPERRRSIWPWRRNQPL